MKSFKLKLLEFYITNVCNLACTGCNRFNNYKFSGFERWTASKDTYATWAEELDAGQIHILGGEPLLNPEFMLWFKGIRELWPDTFIYTITNGYRLNQVAGLYDFILEHKHNTSLNIGIHNKMSKQLIMNNIEKFLTAPLKYEFNSDDPYQEYMFITDINDVKIKVEFNWWFHQGALIKDIETEKFTLHQSNVDQAHSICHSKTCHHLMNGKLYKCGAVALFPEFDHQHQLVLSDQDRALMNSYIPLSITDTVERKKEFINQLPLAIPQCRFCPSSYQGQQIFAQEKRERKT
jgi:organic radical activating enzyme